MFESNRKFSRTILQFASFLTNSIHDAKSEVENGLVPNGQLCQIIHSENVGWEYTQCNTCLAQI
jgi:hypothetical protein